MSVDTSYHDRFLAEQLADSDFRAEYDRASLEISRHGLVPPQVVVQSDADVERELQDLA